MVAEGLPQGMAPDHIFDPYGFCSLTDNAVGLEDVYLDTYIVAITFLGLGKR